jgi:hypothetical protein
MERSLTRCRPSQPRGGSSNIGVINIRVLFAFSRMLELRLTVHHQHCGDQCYGDRL